MATGRPGLHRRLRGPLNAGSPYLRSGLALRTSSEARCTSGLTIILSTSTHVSKLQQQGRDSSRSTHTITMARRQHLTLTIALALTLFFSISYFFSGGTLSGRDGARLTTGAARSAPEKPLQDGHDAGSKSEFTVDLDSLPGSLLEGDSIAPKLENATLK